MSAIHPLYVMVVIYTPLTIFISLTCGDEQYVII